MQIEAHETDSLFGGSAKGSLYEGWRWFLVHEGQVLIWGQKIHPTPGDAEHEGNQYLSAGAQVQAIVTAREAKANG